MAIKIINYLTTEQIQAITDAVLREVSTDNTWEEIKDHTLADLCSINQDALIDDLFENDPRDVEHFPSMISHVKIYDELLGTQRAGEIPEYESSDLQYAYEAHGGNGTVPDGWVSPDEAIEL